MKEEFYHQNIFGETVDIDLAEVKEDEELPLDKKGREFNVFAITDALGARDKKRAWILYQGALAAGLSPEEIFYKIVWQVKCMLLASRTKSVKETDMKDFPYTKAKSYLKNFKEGEIEKLSEDLVMGYHQARRGEGEVETLVERILLSL